MTVIERLKNDETIKTFETMNDYLKKETTDIAGLTTTNKAELLRAIKAELLQNKSISHILNGFSHEQKIAILSNIRFDLKSSATNHRSYNGLINTIGEDPTVLTAVVFMYPNFIKKLCLGSDAVMNGFVSLFWHPTDDFATLRRAFPTLSVNSADLKKYHSAYLDPGNRQSALEAIEVNYTAFENASDQLKNDKDFILKALEKNTSVFDCLPDEMKRDKEVLDKAGPYNQFKVFLQDCWTEFKKEPLGFIGRALMNLLNYCIEQVFTPHGKAPANKSTDSEEQVQLDDSKHAGPT